MSVTLEEFEARKSSYTGRPRKENPADYVDLREKFSTYDALEYEQKNSPYNQDWKALTAFKNGLQSVGEGISGFGVMIQDMVIDSAKEHNPDNSQLDLWKQSIHEHHEADREGIYKQTPVASSSDIGQLGLDVVQGAAQMVPAAVASLLPGGQAVGALVMGASIAGNEYDELRDQGVDERTAASAATINALIQTPFEYIGLSKIFKGLPVTSSLRGYAREFAERVATEGITEFIQEYPEQVSRLWALNSDKPIEDVAEVVRNELGNITSDAAYSGLIGGILGGGLGGAHMGLSSSFQHAMTKEIHNTKMGIVEKQIENITATETNPAVAATVINSTTNNEMVYVDGSTVQEYAQTSGNMRELAIVLGVQEEDIKRAAADGDYLDVRLGNFEAAAAKYNGFFQAVKDDTSFEDGGYTVNGEKLYKQEIEQVKRKTAELEVEQDNVLNSMLTAGVERKQANALLTILTNHAMMMHPENPAQWMRENGLKFQKGVASANAFSQQNQNFKEWFGKSKFVDKDGKPRVAYHGTATKGIEVFDTKKAQDKAGREMGYGWGKDKIYLSTTEMGAQNAASGAKTRGDGNTPTVMPVNLRMEKPITAQEYNDRFMELSGGKEISGESYDAEYTKAVRDKLIKQLDEQLKQEGYDSIIDEDNGAIAVFDPNQIKSVENNGSYSTTDKNIYKQEGEFFNPVISAQMEAIKKMYTNEDGSMKEGYLKAPNGQPTNLGEEQWLLVRTNGFKRWFGNWLYNPNTKIEGTELDNLAGLFPEKGKKDAIRNWLKDLIQGSEVSIDYDGAVVGLQKKRIRASASKSIKDAKVSAYPKLNELIRKSVYFGFEEKDARHENKGVDGQEVYISLAKIDDDYFAVRLKMDVDETKKYLAYKAHQVFTVSDVDIIAIGKEDKVFHGLPDENQDVHRPLPPSFNASISDLVNEINQQITDDEMAKLKVPVDENGNPLTSKVVDENGEPLVVYHGSDKNFDVFDASKTRSSMDIQGSFFSPWSEDAMGYGNNVRAFFLNIKNPANSAKGYKALNTYKGQKEAGIKARDLLAKQGFDGVNNDNEEYIVFESNQIKSATDNNGNFDGNDPNIYHQDNSVIKGSFNPTMQDGQYIISLFKGADASTVIHETGHYFIETMWKAIESGQATKQVEKDFDTLLEYAGMTREQWAAADVQGRSAAHERLAEAFESYIMEGKAPSEQLREAFRKFAEWLKAVYKTIRRSENAIPLTDDVRQVFDRMLAAQDDIAEAERVNKYFAELPKAITENMSEANKARVEKFIDNAREKALDVLTRKAMENFSSERQEEISNYRAEVLPEVTEEIKERRTYKNGYTREDVKKYQALQDIVTGENEVGKELTPEDEVYMMQFDLTAESFGYSSTNEMVQDIMNSPTEKQAITQAVNELVNAKFPDYMTEKKAREEAIQEAIYNDENGLLIGVEQQLIEEYATKAMNRQIEAEAKKEAAKVEGGEKKQGPAAKTKEEMRIRAAAYRQQAKTMAKEAIGRMIISDATRTQKYVTLERRAAMKSAECMAKKDYREALTQKNLQAYYHAMVQESIKAKRTVDKNRRYLKRQVKAKKEAWVSEAHFAEVSALFMRMGIAHKKHDDTGRIGVTLREYADAMNEKYDCAEFADWLLNMPDYEPLSDTRMYTLEQFNDMVDAVRNIRAIAKAEKGAGMFEKAESFEALKKDILENLDKLKTVFTPDPNKPTQATLTERFWAALENSDTFFERMDNWSQGFFTNTFFAKIKHSNDMEYDCREKYDKAVIEANNEWLPDKAAMAAAEEKIYYEELGTSVSKHILVKMLMNMGNKENARRLAETCPIGFEKGTIWNPMSEDSMLLPEEALELTQHNILEFLQNNLTAEDVRYAQKMVNAAGSFWTEKNEMEKRVKGFGLKKVEATPQVLTIGGKEVVFQGGYFPLIRNGELGSHPVTQEVGADDPLQGRNIRTLHTNSGSTKHRTLGAKYPVNLFPGAETQVMYDSIHDLCWRECVNDFRRVLNDGDIYTALKTKLGPARMSVFREMLEKAAQPNSTQSADFAERTVGAAASWLRNKSANAIIMMNLKINLQNFGNVFLFGQSVEGFGHADTLHALGNFKMNFADAKGYSDLTEFIFSKSAFMRERMTIPDISVRDIMEDPTNKQSEFEKSVLRLGTKLMVYTDGITAKPVWLEAYRKSLANGKTEQEAVDFADTVIRRTLGSTRMTDVSSLQRGGAIYKLMTMFQSFFNTQYNQWVREKNLVQKMYTEGQKREAFENAFAFVTSKFVFTCMASLALSLENPFGIDDDDGWPELLKEMKNYSFSMFGPVGQVGSNLVGNMLGMKEFGYRMSVVQSTLEKMTRTGKTVNKVVTGESKTPVADMAETTTDVAGFVLGVPQQVNKVLWNTYDILVNDMDPRLEDLTRRRPKKERKPDK